MIRIRIRIKDLGGVLVHPRLLQVLEAGVNILLPEILQLRDLSGRQLPSPQLLGVTRHLED